MKLVLDIPEGLTDEQRGQLRQLFYDALGEFVSVRGNDLDEPAGTLTYVNKRYPNLEGMQRERKIDEVMARKQLARKLRRAASGIKVEDDRPGPLARLREAALCAREGILTPDELIDAVLARTET